MKLHFLLNIALVLGWSTVAQAKNSQPSREESAPVNVGVLDQDLLSRLVVEETNRFRISQGRGPLTVSEPLTTAAVGHAKAMAENGFFAHKNPHDSRQRNLTDRISHAGLKSRAVAENIALTYALDFRDLQAWIRDSRGSRSRQAPPVLEYTYRALARSVVQQWINSQGHRRNLLGRPYSQIGLGFAAAKDPQGRGKVYCVQTFCASL